MKFSLNQMSLSIQDFEPILDQLNRTYEVLNYKSPLALRTIRNLDKGLGISPQVLATDNAK